MAAACPDESSATERYRAPLRTAHVDCRPRTPPRWRQRWVPARGALPYYRQRADGGIVVVHYTSKRAAEDPCSADTNVRGGGRSQFRWQA
jgi:hypothetical protein